MPENRPAAPDYADKIAAELIKTYLLDSIAFDVDQRAIVQSLLKLAATDGYLHGYSAATTSAVGQLRAVGL